MTYSKYKKNYRRNKKSKWRQQKISVGTIQKIAKQEARKLDKKDDVLHRYSLAHAADGFTWSGQVDLPPPRYWRPVIAGGMEAKTISNFEGYIKDGNINTSTPGSTINQSLTVKVTAIQARFAIRNTTKSLTAPYYTLNESDCRCCAMLVFIPNLSDTTDQSVDFLRPDNFMLYKRGSGNLIYDGLDKDTLKNAAASQASAYQYIILDRKVFTLKALKNGPFETTGTALSTKYITLSKFFKRPRKHNIKASGTAGGMFTDGNYCYILYSNLSNETPTKSIQYVGATTCQFKIGAQTFPVGS